MNRFAQEKNSNKDDYDSLPTCESYLLGKMIKSSFIEKDEWASDVLGLIHTDVCGCMSTCVRGGYSYFITFTNDLSRYGYIYLMKHKSESFKIFKQFRNEVEKQTEKDIKTLQSDRGGEYLSSEFLTYLVENGILS